MEFELYDTVRVGRGSKLWTVQELWGGRGGQQLATLRPINGYSNTTVSVDRLVLVTRGERDEQD